jgi:Tol biopolymer transport system component
MLIAVLALFFLVKLALVTPAVSDQEKTPLAVSAKNFTGLPPNFDSDFRFYNEFGLKGRIAFTAKISGYDKILALDLNSKRIDKIADTASNNSYPAWSPTGDKIAFTSDRDGNKEIYIANSDGSNVQRITSNAAADDNANWSPDGKSIVFYSGVDNRDNTPETNLFLYDVNTKKISQLTNLKGKNSVPEFSKDGKQIAYTTSRFWPGWDICVYDMQKQSDSCPLTGTSTYCRPSFSHNGKFIAYSSGLISSINAYTYNIETKNSDKIVSEDGNEYDLKWDISDQFIIFASDKTKKDLYNLYAVRLSDGVVSLLLSAPYSLRYLSWYQEQAK